MVVTPGSTGTAVEGSFRSLAMVVTFRFCIVWLRVELQRRLRGH